MQQGAALGQVVLLHPGMPQKAPFPVPVRRSKAPFRQGLLCKVSCNVIALRRGAVRACGEPALLIKGDRSQEHFSAQVMERHPQRLLPEAQTENVPVPPGILHQITVTDALNRVGCFVPVGQHRVVGISRKRPPQGFAPGIGNHMPVLGASLRCH